MSTPLTQEFLTQFAPRYTASWTAKEVASNPLSPLITEDIYLEDPMLPQPLQGSAAVLEVHQSTLRAFPDLVCELMDPLFLAADGKTVMFHWRLTGTLLGPLPNGAPPTGKAMSVQGVDRWEFRDGRICKFKAFYDLFGMLRQLGLIPA